MHKFLLGGLSLILAVAAAPAAIAQAPDVLDGNSPEAIDESYGDDPANSDVDNQDSQSDSQSDSNPDLSGPDEVAPEALDDFYGGQEESNEERLVTPESDDSTTESSTEEENFEGELGESETIAPEAVDDSY